MKNSRTSKRRMQQVVGIPAGQVTDQGSAEALSYFLMRGQAPSFGAFVDDALFQSDASMGPVPPECRAASLAQGCSVPPLDFCPGTGERPCPRLFVPFKEGCVSPLSDTDKSFEISQQRRR